MVMTCDYPRAPWAIQDGEGRMRALGRHPRIRPHVPRMANVYVTKDPHALEFLAPDGSPMFTARKSGKEIPISLPDGSPAGSVREVPMKVKSGELVQYRLLGPDDRLLGQIEFRLEVTRPERLSLLLDTSDIFLCAPDRGVFGRIFRYATRSPVQAPHLGGGRREIHTTEALPEPLLWLCLAAETLGIYKA